MDKQKRLPKWGNILFLVSTPVLLVALTPLLFIYKTTTWWLVLAYLGYGALTSLCITAGYHRLFAHKSYEASPAVKLFYLIFGSASFQGSILQWGTDHRRHHAFVDGPKDPHNINEGFWHAHIGWLFTQDPPEYRNQFAPDLMRDKAIRFQHQFYEPMAFLMGFGVPMGFGWLFGDPIGGLVIGGFFRIVFTQHCTFFINSLAHVWGRKTYDPDQTARDNPWLAFFTYGEAYHNFHHKFASDFRNGVRWYHWDPSKWLIVSLSFSGLASRLRRTSSTDILKARVHAEEITLIRSGFSPDLIAPLKQRLLESQQKWRNLVADYKRIKKNMHDQSRDRLSQMKLELKLAKLEFRYSFTQWATYCRQRAVVRVA